MIHRLFAGAVLAIATINVLYAQEKQETVELPQLNVGQKWEMAESNLIYFVICGISYAKANGQTADDYGVWAGKVACPYWQSLGPLTPAKFVQQISENKQQFKGFQMEILEAAKSYVKGRMKSFGDDQLPDYHNMGGVTLDDYKRFFAKKWESIADCVNLVYTSKEEGEWVYFTVSEKKR